MLICSKMINYFRFIILNYLRLKYYKIFIKIKLKNYANIKINFIRAFQNKLFIVRETCRVGATVFPSLLISFFAIKARSCA